jgi:hypothetical protein
MIDKLYQQCDKDMKKILQRPSLYQLSSENLNNLVRSLFLSIIYCDPKQMLPQINMKIQKSRAQKERIKKKRSPSEY